MVPIYANLHTQQSPTVGKELQSSSLCTFFEIRPSATNQKSLRAHYLQIDATTSYAQQHFGSAPRILVD